MAKLYRLLAGPLSRAVAHFELAERQRGKEDVQHRAEDEGQGTAKHGGCGQRKAETVGRCRVAATVAAASGSTLTLQLRPAHWLTKFDLRHAAPQARAGLQRPSNSETRLLLALQGTRCDEELTRRTAPIGEGTRRRALTAFECISHVLPPPRCHMSSTPAHLLVKQLASAVA